MIDTTAARATARAELAALMEGFPVQVLPGFTGIAPRPVRAAQIDPETRLHRKSVYVRPLHEAMPPKSRKPKAVPQFAAGPLTDEERQLLREMADQL